jgi:hypothetical protein
MSVIDEKQEAIACIRMAVDNNDLAQLNSDAPDDDVELEVDLGPESHHRQLGSPEGKKSNLRVVSAELGSEREEFRRLDERVRDFIACHMPEEAMRYEEDIYVSLSTDFTREHLFHSVLYIAQVQRYKCVTLKYQSKVDWTEARDILRCNSDFHGQPRFDCVVIHDDAPGITCARLQSLIRCWLPSGKVVDFAIIHGFTRSGWKPRTLWKGCRVLDEDEMSSIVQMDYLLRGALMCPVSGKDDERAHYLIDTVDPDMFLRANY